MTAHEIAAAGIHQLLERSPVYVEPTPTVSADELARALQELADDWRIDLDFAVAKKRIKLRGLVLQPDTLAPWVVGE